MASKYLKGGALNPAWCEEQDAELKSEIVMDLLESFEDEDVDVNLEISDGINVVIRKNKESKETNNICTIADNDYEAMFNFLKRHSATPEDYRIAKDIIGLK